VRVVRARKVLREGRVGSSHTCLDNVFAYMHPPVVPACLLSEVVTVLVNVDIGKKQGKHMTKETIQKSKCLKKLPYTAKAFYYSNTPLPLSLIAYEYKRYNTIDQLRTSKTQMFLDCLLRLLPDIDTVDLS
jgi:hypothetical protein